MNRKFDAANGIVCSLTGKIAAFEQKCEFFVVDSSVVIPVNSETVLYAKELKSKLPAKMYEQLQQQQDLPKAIAAGVFVAILCSVVWAAIALWTTLISSGLAILLGVAVGLSMRHAGKGIDTSFAISGAVISLLGCLLGNFLAIIGFIAGENELGYFETLIGFDYSYLPDVMIETFAIIHLVFYFLAASFAFSISRQAVTEKDIKEMNGK
ncbi:MAG TPA: hypothetical protein VIU13_05405 [Chryseolinea sp.]